MILEEKMKKMEEGNKKIEFDPRLPVFPDLMEERMRKEKNKMMEGKNEKIMSPAEESQRKMRKLEERLEKAEEDIEEIKKFLMKEGKRVEEEKVEDSDKDEEEVPPKLSLSKFYLIETAKN